MMISLESHYEEYLKGKTKEEIMTAIRGLKQEIGRLKNSMESLGYGDNPITIPYESTCIYWIHEYFEKINKFTRRYERGI